MKRVIVLFCFVLAADGRVIVVPDSAATIQAGLGMAGAGDTVLVRPGTYSENIVWPATDGIKLFSMAGPDSTVIDGGGNRVVQIGTGITRTTELRGFTIRGGKASSGAGIMCAGSPVIAGNRICNNECRGGWDYGAGIFIGYQSAPLIIGNEIADNRCSDTATWNYGGGIFVDMRATPEIGDNLITRNECSQGYWNYGAGIYCDLQSNPFIYQNIIVDNTNTLGDRGHGAGICVETQAQALIFANLVIGNHNTSGLWNYGAGLKVAGKAALINNTIVGNVCAGGHWAYGGGVYVDYNDSALIKNNIIVQNSAASGGGIYNQGYVANRYNDVWNNAGGNYYGCSAGPGAISLDPLFVTGGRGQYYLSQIAAGQAQNSPCRDAADTLLWTWPVNLDSLLRTWTTRTDSVFDEGVLDMGYHYPGGHPVGVREQLGPARVRAQLAGPTLFAGPVVFTTNLPGPARLMVYDLTGKLVYQSRGQGRFVWDDPGRPAAVYYYRILTRAGVQTGRVVKLSPR